ncbi:MAG: NAD-glutamate dehydrogenase [Actinomycetales bacterium]|nr:NAD-glutamate dehydrogenase [Actinomycetales bacterium]
MRRLLDRAAWWSFPPGGERVGRRGRDRPVPGADRAVCRAGAAGPPGVRKRRRLERRAKERVEGGTPEPLAMRAASLLDVFSLLDIVRIAHDSNTHRSRTHCASTTTRVRTRGIDDMLFRVSQLPREDRWDALARGALRDDLYAVLDGITRGVLATSNPSNDAKTRVRGVDHGQLGSSGPRRGLGCGPSCDWKNPNIAALSVALRTLRAFVRSSGAE